MIKVHTVDVLHGYRLALSFSDGTTGIVDLSALVKEDPMLALEEPAVFDEAIVEQGSVEWPNHQIGIATEALYAMAHGLSSPETLEQANDNELRVSLKRLRETFGKTQTELARRHQAIRL